MRVSLNLSDAEVKMLHRVAETEPKNGSLGSYMGGSSPHKGQHLPGTASPEADARRARSRRAPVLGGQKKGPPAEEDRLPEGLSHPRVGPRDVYVCQVRSLAWATASLQLS